MHMIIWFVIFTSLIGSIGTIYAPPEDHVYTVVDGNQTLMLNTYMASTEALNKRHIVMQEYDYSCGSAALATLLNYHLGENFTERQVIMGLMRYGDPERIRQRRAFSFLDMKRFVDALGYRGAGYKAELTNLLELDAPAILPIRIGAYDHFVVFRGIHDNRAFLADPWLGDTTYPVKVFEDMWFRKVIFMADSTDRPTRDLLALNKADMRYIDEDTVLWMLFPPQSPHIEYSLEREELRYLDPDAQIYQR